MRVGCAVFVLLYGCQSASSGTSELTHDECANLVRHVQRLQSDDAAGLQRALDVGLKSGIEGCLEKGTQRAYRCVLQAENTTELANCDALMK
jgi:hypothetical protein